MELYIGGAWQGQLEYAKQEHPNLNWVDGAVCTTEDILKADGVFDFHKYLKRRVEEELNSPEDQVNAADWAGEILDANPELIVVSDEVGYGIVPIDHIERVWREAVGRACTKLAVNSRRVTRVVCGIGTVIKND